MNIALVLDQSGSMAENGKQAALQSAANEAITDLTGTPSNVAIYTFGQTTGLSIAKTSTINAASAAPLHTFINALPAPAGGTNWDQGLAQVASGFDEVIFLTDGAPTGSRIRTNNFAHSLFTDTEQGIFSANGIKASGERILGVGIGLHARGGGQSEGRLRIYAEPGLFSQFEHGLRGHPQGAGYRRLQQPAHDHQADPESQRCADQPDPSRRQRLDVREHYFERRHASPRR